MAEERSTPEIIDALWPVTSRQITERAAAGVELLELLLHARGPLRRRDHELWAGDFLVNEDRELLPRVGRATGAGFSVYLGNRRIASFGSLDAGGALEVGGYADAELVDTVLRHGRAFSGTLDGGGRRLLVSARPLQPTDSMRDYGALGMIEAHQDVDAIRQGLAAALQESWGTSAQSARTDQADRMSGVMKFIDDVARRLQLLALNGNIIAAQAGEHGRAFRVVCRELGSLAEQSKDAVGEVRALLDQLTTEDDPVTPGSDDPADPADPAEDDVAERSVS